MEINVLVLPVFQVGVHLTLLQQETHHLDVPLRSANVQRRAVVVILLLHVLTLQEVLSEHAHIAIVCGKQEIDNSRGLNGGKEEL